MLSLNHWTCARVLSGKSNFSALIQWIACSMADRCTNPMPQRFSGKHRRGLAHGSHRRRLTLTNKCARSDIEEHGDVKIMCVCVYIYIYMLCIYIYRERERYRQYYTMICFSWCTRLHLYLLFLMVFFHMVSPHLAASDAALQKCTKLWNTCSPPVALVITCALSVL